MKGKQRMSNFKFRCIVIPIAAFLLILGIGLIIAADIFKPFMDSWFGKGKETTTGSTGLTADYYDDKYESYTQSREAAYRLNEQVADEGIILLKNNGVLPLAKNSAVVPFGYQYTDTFFGQEAMGGGSSKPVADPVPPSEVLRSHFSVSDKTEAVMKKASVQSLKEASGTISASDGGGLGGDCILKEYDPAIYSSLGSLGGTGIVFVGREGHEDFDYKFDAYSDGTPHYLALTKNELGTIKAAKAACDKVVVVVLASNIMELSPLMSGEYEVDAILWAGHPGEKGLVSVGKILVGEVNPSARTVDIFPTDFTADPTYQNIGAMYYSNEGMTKIPFIEYEESIYVGYRYYETAVIEDNEFVYGVLDGKGAIATRGAVAYPFGYGLSYTEFEKTMTHKAESGKIDVEVTVTNIGNKAGKEVVQLYVTPEYTEYDAAHGIEKSAVALLDFGKTDLLEKDASGKVRFTFDEQEFVVYDSTHDNPDGTKGCYMLEKGDYIISLRNNSHDVIDSFTYTVDETVYFDSENPRDSEKAMQAKLDEEGNPTDIPEKGEKFIAATDKFSQMTEYMKDETTSLSRSDWKNTFPTRPSENKRKVGDKYASDIVAAKTFDYKTDPLLGNVEGSKVYSAKKPTSGADNGLTVSMLRGRDYNDPEWDKLLDQIDWSKMTTITNALFKANYMNGKINDIGLPETVHSDGANGIKNPANAERTATYVYSPVMSATWNTKLMEELGAMVAAEAMEVGICGWYSPAFNIHRSPFQGRVFEYYSEDPVLSGKIATAVVQGASNGGLQCYIKHFVLNDMETNRAKGLTTWASEQVLREVYMKPFEMVIRDARMTVKYYDSDNKMQSKIMRASNALMAAQNHIGTTQGFCNYDLLTGVVRNEWGFNGAIITDMYSTGITNIQDWVLRAGCDMFMCSVNAYADKTSATSLNLLREAVHRVAFSVVNSNKMQGVAPGGTTEYGISPWYSWVVPIIVVILLAAAALGVLIVLRGFDEKKHPDNYVKGQRK